MNRCHEIKRFGLSWGGGTDQATPIILGNFEEAVGTLLVLDHGGSALDATIGGVRVLLPAEMEEELKPLIGQKVGVIKTDDPDRPYRVRTIG